MITALASLFGFLSSLLPDIIGLFKDRSDKQHELAILRMQMEQQAAGHMARLEEIGAQADIAESRAIYKTYSTGIRWVDALNGTVRPVIAYAFFLLYAGVKAMQFSYADPSLPWTVQALWGQEDQAIFAAVISFYFGNRAMSKVRKGQ